MKTKKKAWGPNGGSPYPERRTSRRLAVINLNIFSLSGPLKEITRKRKGVVSDSVKVKTGGLKEGNPEGKPNAVADVCHFHSAMKGMLVFAQFFGVMPVINILNRDVSALRFRWWSFPTVYCIVCGLSLVVYSVFTVAWSVKTGFEFGRIVPIIFYTSNTLGYFIFIRLAIKWPQIMTRWRSTEALMSPLLMEQSRRVLTRKIKFLAVIVMSLSFLEHFLSISTNIYMSNNCPNVDDKVKAMFMQQFSQIFSFTHYALWKALLARYTLSLGTFCWTYMDCFVILISVGLAQLLKMLNKELMILKGQNLPQHFWERKRNHYRAICDLCEKVDDAMSMVTIISFSNNLFFICVQLLNTMNPKPSKYHTFYFWYSFIFLVVRTLAVSLYSADINEEARKIVEVIRVAPKESWCIELKRFYDEVTNDVVALSGMKLFYLTKRLVLNVAGTIITYELVLIQFDQDDDISKSDHCAPIYG